MTSRASEILISGRIVQVGHNGVEMKCFIFFSVFCGKFYFILSQSRSVYGDLGLSVIFKKIHIRYVSERHCAGTKVEYYCGSKSAIPRAQFV